MTTQVAFLFPGQGSQAVGMGADVFEVSEAVKEFATNQIKVAVAVKVGETW